VVVVRWNRDEHRVGVADAVRIRGERAVAGSDVVVADHAGRVDASAVGRNGGFVDIVPGDVDPDPIEESARWRPTVPIPTTTARSGAHMVRSKPCFDPSVPTLPAH